MDKIALIIPVKGNNPKGRLAPLFDSRERKQLQIAMLEDTLQAVVKARKIAQAHVVSSDPEILKFAERYGAMSIPEEGDAGVNQAVEGAIEKLGRYDGWLIMPADLPLITSGDIKTVFLLHRMGSSVVIAPSEDYSGTNLLLMTKRRGITLHYDDDSFNKHIREASESRTHFAVYYSENVSFDIDHAGDVHRYFKFGRRNSTMTFLERTLKRARKMESRMQSDEGRAPDREL